MSYNHEQFPHYIRTAGKITVLTALTGILVFIFALVFDVGTKEFNRVSAQTATTTLTVLNTPPAFTLEPYEVVESSTSSPTNSGDVIQWSAIGTDSNNAPYFLLVCSTNASPTANAASGPSTLGSAPPDCGGGAIQWGVSASTTSGSLATVSTTTSEVGQFAEIQDWFAWVCDDDPNNPRCNNVPSQGLYATSSSPFNVNFRPQFINFYNDGPVDPGAIINFLSTSTDPDIVGGSDDLFILVCSTNTNYSSSTNTCTTEISSSTVGISQHASTSYTITIPTRDQAYAAYAYIFDEHGHTATGSPIYVPFTVSNVAPTVLGGDIDLYGDAGPGSALLVSIEAGETPSSTIDFTIKDNNSCLTAASTSEIVSFDVSVFRSGVGSSSCAVAGDYDPNNCYTSTIGTTTTWQLSCNATTTCASPNQDYMDYSCTFPLWFVADPTDGGTPFAAQNWSAGVVGSDNNFATGTMATTSNPKELISFAAIDILASDIAYGSLEPGSDTGTLVATSTLQNVGNTGLDQDIQGDSMCSTYSPSTPCPGSATSTIDASQQEFGTSTTFAYGGPESIAMSSTTAQELELNALKTTSTSTPFEKDTYWGIGVPLGITFSGAYSGLNTFTAVTAEAADW
jgi:hypothetical protein